MCSSVPRVSKPPGTKQPGSNTIAVAEADLGVLRVSVSKTLNVARSESDLEELASSRCTLSLLVGESVDGSGRFSRSSSPDCRARCPQKLVGRGRSFRPDGRMRTPSRIADTNIMSHLTPHNLLTYCEQNKRPRVSRGDRGKRSPTDPICDRKTIAGPPAT